MNAINNKDLFGAGPAFPFKRSKGGNFKMASGNELVTMCFKQILRTGAGERPMQKHLSPRINELIFSIEGESRDQVVREFLNKGIKDFDTRIKVLDVKVSDTSEEGEFSLAIQYMFVMIKQVESTEFVHRVG